MKKDLEKKENKANVNLESNLEKKPLRKLSSKKMRSGKKRLKDYGKVLLAKQLLRALYNNPREKIFKRYFGKEKSINDVIGSLNRRLEIVLTAMGGAVSNSHARQLINHGKISVNGHIVKERGYLLKDGDIVASAVSFVKPLDQALLSKNAGSQIVTPLNQQLEGARLHKTESLVVASLKPRKIPKYLKLKTPPLSAQILVNYDLNYGIYYGKPIVQTALEVSDVSKSKGLSSYEGFEGSNSIGQVGFGWKNTNVKAVKNLLLEMKTANEEEKMKICTLLYSLVQAYYSRVK